MENFIFCAVLAMRSYHNTIIKPPDKEFYVVVWDR